METYTFNQKLIAYLILGVVCAIIVYFGDKNTK